MDAYNQWREMALSCGFDHVHPLDAGKLQFLPEVREMCAANRCHSYGRSWSCPPAIGDITVGEVRAKRFKRGILVQTVGQLEDSFDIEGIEAAQQRHANSFAALLPQLRQQYPDLFPMGAGACRLCEEGCTYPDAPCRFPERMAPSMEAWGLWVTQVCNDCGAKYNHGPDTIAFSSCILLEPA